MLIDKPVLCPVLIGRGNDLQVLDRLRLSSFDLVISLIGAMFAARQMGR